MGSPGLEFSLDAEGPSSEEIHLAHKQEGLTRTAVTGEYRSLRRGTSKGHYTSPGQRVSIVFGRRLNSGRISNKLSSHRHL